MNAAQARLIGAAAVVSSALPTKMEVPQQDDNAMDENAGGNGNGNSSSSSSSSNSSSSSSSSSSSDSSSNDSDSSSSSSESDEAQQPGNSLELAQITNEVIELPRDICEYESIFREFFTEELWTELTQEQRAQLQKQLPDFTALLEPNEAMAEQLHTVHLLFQNKLDRFGYTPLGELHRNLEAGHYRPDIRVWRDSIAKSKRREQRFRECERLGILSKRLFVAREHLLRSAYSQSPDENVRLERSLQKQKQQHSFLFNGDTKMSAVRARKRFYMEMAEMKKQTRLWPSSSDKLSADEEDSDEEASLEHLTEDWVAEELNALKSVATVSSTTDKCIYDTFFKRRPNFTDEESMRLSQYAKRPKLTHRNYREYLLDYKRKKLMEPNLPDYETADIRLRDVCSRAQVSGNFKRNFTLGQKPGRKAKPKSNEPPALVPINSEQTKFSNDLVQRNKVTTVRLLQPQHQQQQQQQQQQQHQQHQQLAMFNQNQLEESFNQNDTFDVYDGEIEVQQEEVETYANEGTLPSNYIVNNDVFVTTNAVRSLPKLEPILQRGIGFQSKNKMNPILNSNVNAAFNVVTTLSNELIQETHACFFSLIRDFFCATPNHRMKFDELKQRIHIWLGNPITALNDWYASSSNWASLLTSAVKFLAGDFVEQPDEYVPYIDFKANLNIYQWIGAGRDSDARLTELCNYWMEHRKEMHPLKPGQSRQQLLRLNVVRSNNNITNNNNNNNTNNNQSAVIVVGGTSADMNDTTNHITGTIDNNSVTLTATPTTTFGIHNSVLLTPPPLPRFPTKWTVRAATAEEIQEFQRQERERFEQPHRAYTYRMNGYESVVGPVRGIYSQTLALTKARGHSMMVDDRPNFVTILTLVRDATARLPNGEGTRADISELLKCSQYINPDAAENVMQTIVSGALDRLHTENDPCVRYDPKRKIWIYLHRNRTEEEFERMHQQQQGQPKAQKLLKSTTTTTTATMATLDATRKMLPKTVIKAIGSTQSFTSMSIPALVPSNPVLISAQPSTVTSASKQQQQQQHHQQLLQQQQIQTKQTSLPVPPLKYNIPTQGTTTTILQQQQKSLLKAAMNPQRRIIDAKTGATFITTGVNTAQKLTKLPQSSKFVTASTATTAATTTTIAKSPFILGTAGGIQSLHMPANATVAGKRVALSKPIIINQISSNSNKSQQMQQQQHQLSAVNRNNTTQIITMKAAQSQQQQQQLKQQTTQSFIIPMNATGADIHLQQQLIQQGNVSALSPTRTINTNKSGVHTIVVDPNTTFATINTTSTADVNKATPKNIIRFVPNVKQQQIQQQHQQQQQLIGNKLIGRRVVTATNTSNSTTLMGATKILGTVINNASGTTTVATNNQATATTLLPNNATIVSTSVAGSAAMPGTIIKMSPQAFNALQQKQQQQQMQQIKAGGPKVTITATQQQQKQQQQHQQQQQQQRLIIGNTAIIAHTAGSGSVGKNITILQQQSPTQASPKALSSNTIITNTKSVDVATSTTPTNTNKVQMVNATSLTPQQQRMLIQNLKQQQLQQHQQKKPVAVVVSQTPTGGITRVLKTTATATMGTSTASTATTTTTLNATNIINTSSNATGQIVTLDSLLQQTQQQQQQQTQHLNSSIESNSGTIITPISAAQFSNLIAISGGGGVAGSAPRLITTQATSNATNVITGVKQPAGGGLRVIQTASSGSSGAAAAGTTPTTFSIANIQGKQVVFATKPSANSKQGTNIGQIIQAPTGSGVVTTNVSAANVIFSGQTLKLQGNQLQNVTKVTSGTLAGVNSTPTSQATQMQTVIMGNQILRVMPQTLGAATAATNKAVGEATNTLQNRIVATNINKGVIATSTVGPSSNLGKTVVLNRGANNSGTQTIRLQSTTTTSSTAIASQHETTPASLQKTATSSTSTAGRVVLAVQGGGQILLPSNFAAGGTLNLKSLQNMKLVSLTQVPQQLQDKSKSSIANTASSSKTVVKTIGSNNGTAIG